MSTKTINTLLISWLMGIVFFVAKNNIEYQHLWNLGYYSTYYIIVFIAFKLVWKKYNNILTRSLLLSLLIYYTFHCVMQVVEIFDEDLKKQLYTGKIINYMLSLSLGLSLFTLTIIKKVKSKISINRKSQLKNEIHG